MAYHPFDASRTAEPSGRVSTKDSQASPATAISTGAYSCPMHPEVFQTAPGSCPKCGMALVKKPQTTAMTVRPLLAGFEAFALLLVVYFGMVSLISGADFAFDQFSLYWYFILLLALGFGIQVGLYVHLKALVSRHRASGKMVAVTGTTSTAAMISCCAHYLANVVPILGIAGFLTVVAQYQVELFWVGLAFNAAGIAYVVRNVVKFSREQRT